MATKGIYKSTNELQTVGVIRPATGFDAWPASAIGRQVAVGHSQAAEARLLIAYTLAGPTSRGASWRASEGNFSAQDLTGVPTGAGFFRIRALTDQLWFICWFNTDIDRDSGSASRTKNGGSTWDDPLADVASGRLWNDFCRTADGRIWGLTVENEGTFDHVEVWFSDDDGDTWIESYDDTAPTGQQMWTLFCHPMDANRIGVFGFVDVLRRDPQVFFTINGKEGASATWNVNTEGANIFASGSLGRRFGVMQIASNRIIITQLDLVGDWSVFTSDDNGANWIKRQVIATDLTSQYIMGPVGEPAGSRLYIMRSDRTGSPFKAEIWESVDGGISWSDLGNDAPIPAATDDHKGGLAYDPIEKALYVYGAAEGNSDNVRHIMKLFPVSSAGVWVDVSDTIVPASGRASYNISAVGRTTHGIAVIPQ